jgi:ATP-dependent Zn protease
LIDAEVQGIVTSQYERAQRLLKRHRKALEKLTNRLLDQETVDGCAVAEALGKKEDCEL